MKIEKGKVVAISYTLDVEGKVMDSAPVGKPLEYIQGEHMLISGLEKALEGKQAGESYDATIAPEEAYGVYNPQLKFDIPKSSFEVEGKLREDLLVVGNLIPMLNGAGQVVHGMIAAVKEDMVTMDFNHSLAGKTLHFTGEIVSVREATQKEIKEGLHGEYLPQEEHHCHHHEKGHCCHEGEGHCNHDGEGHCNHDGDHECCHGEGKSKCDCQ